MASVNSLRALGLLWLGLFALVAIAQPAHLMELNLLSILIALGIGAFLFPGITLAVGILSLVPAPEHYYFVDQYVQAHLSFLGVHTIQKIVVVASIIPAMARLGLRPNFNIGLAAMVGMYVISVLFSSRWPGLTQPQMLKTLVALLMPFLIFQIKIKRTWIEPILLVIACLPILSVLLGYVAQLSGMRDILRRPWEIMSQDYAGAYRLGGITISAYLAFHAFAAFFVSLYQAIIFKRKFYYFLSAIAFVILVLTGTRTPIVCSILFAGFAFLFASPRDLQGSSKFVLFVVGATLIGALMAVYGDNLLVRFLPGYKESVINTSGRAAAWTYLLTAFQVNPIFGRGVGTSAIILADDAAFSQTIAAAHNEFLRLLVDAGIVGLFIYVSAFVAFFVREARAFDRGQAILLWGVLLSFAAYSFTDNTISAPPSLVLFFALVFILAKARLMRTRLPAA
jgi:O-antigen ligase